MSAFVRLRERSHSGVEVPVRPLIHRPMTEGYCVVATRGGELPEVNCQSVTEIREDTKQRELDSARRWDEPANAVRSPLRSPCFPDREGPRPGRGRPAEPGPRAEKKNSEPTKSRGLTIGWLETEWQEA